jgi:ankyrin repeat protein
LNQFGLSLSLVWENLNGLVWGLAKSGLNQTKPNFPNTMLVEHGASVELQDGGGKSPLDIVSVRQHDKIVKLLLEHHAK